MHISHCSFNFKSVHSRRMTTQKVSIFFYSLPQNSEKSANNRFHAKLVKYSNFYDIFADVSPILMKFGMIAHISYPEHKSCSKGKFKKKSTWWSLLYKKSCQMRYISCLLYTSPSPRDRQKSRMPSSA